MSDSTAAPLGLRDEFPVPTLDQWHDECVRLLRGASAPSAASDSPPMLVTA